MLDFRQALCQKSEEAPGGFKSLEFEGIKKEAGLITITAALHLPQPSTLYTLYNNRQISYSILHLYLLGIRENEGLLDVVFLDLQEFI